MHIVGGNEVERLEDDRSAILVLFILALFPARQVLCCPFCCNICHSLLAVCSAAANCDSLLLLHFDLDFIDLFGCVPGLIFTAWLLQHILVIGYSLVGGFTMTLFLRIRPYPLHIVDDF